MESALIVVYVLRGVARVVIARTGFVLEMTVFPRHAQDLTVTIGTATVISVRTTAVSATIAMVVVARIIMTRTMIIMTTTAVAVVKEAQAGVLVLSTSLKTVWVLTTPALISPAPAPIVAS
jgi:hypothetical protein